MKINHFGYAVNNIQKSIGDFKLLGYSIEEIEYKDNDRQVKIRFIEKDGIKLELIEPMNDKSPVYDLLKKNGSIIYHICYETENFDKDIRTLIENKFVIVEKPKKAIALGGKKVTFLYKKNMGLIEVVEILWSTKD